MNEIDTRTRLMLEGRRLFAEKGFRGASVRDITRAASANLGAITYHFGSKRALYVEVLERLFSDLAACVEAAAAPAGPAPDRIEAVVEALFAFFRRNPDAPRLMLHQFAAGEPVPEPVIPFLRRNLAAIRAVVLDGRDTGELRPADPLLVAFTIISQSIWFNLVGRPLHAVLGVADDPESFAARIQVHVAEVANRFLAPEA